MATKLDRLYELGQSVWYDNISREVLETGELQRLVDLGVRGVTSNPTIFKSAIVGSTAYDAQMRSMLGGDHTPQAVYEALAVEDIRRACDILRPVFEATDHVDGFVSLEVSPLLASDTTSTLAEVRRLHPMVERPNLYIKIPATSEGIPAIEQALFEGYNINITLIFSRKTYERVMEAYMRALERRVEAGKDISEVRSVASFFVSRVDTLVDKMLEKIAASAAEPGNPQSAIPERFRDLMGKAAVANAKLAYQDFLRVFRSQRFQRLTEKGAKVQRPLWASTSTKNPAYSDILYVGPLIGPDTVNTMPGETIEAFLDHGTAALTVEQGVDEAQRLLDALEAVGVSMDAVTQQLLDEGIQKFSEPFEALLGAIEEKTRQLAAAG